jgi:hypothetical protein
MESFVDQQYWLEDVAIPAQRIAREALRTVDATYSFSGNHRDDARAELYMPYHNGIHTRKVCQDIRLLRDVVGLTDTEYAIAVMAGASHDVMRELDDAPGMSEQDSAQWLLKQMDRYQDIFTPYQKKMGSLAVLATTCRWEKGRMSQLATEQEYATNSAQLVSHVVAAADLGRIYAPDGPLMAHKLHQEMTTGASGLAPNIETLLPFQRGQVNFLEDGYRYPNQEITRVLSERKGEVCAYVGSLVTALEAGNIESWDELLARDVAFMQQAA